MRQDINSLPLSLTVRRQKGNKTIVGIAPYYDSMWSRKRWNTSKLVAKISLVAGEMLILLLAIFTLVLLVGHIRMETSYLVNTPNCRIPDFNPFDDSVRHFYQRFGPTSCDSDVPPLTSVTSSTHYNTLHLHHDRFKFYYLRTNSSHEPILCCYRLITVGNYDGFKMSWCKIFNLSMNFTGAEEFIQVICKQFGPTSTIVVYNNFHACIGFNENIRKKTNTLVDKTKLVKMGDLSVMILGFDSISRMNMMRTMPKTMKYLEETGWYTMKGYNKIGDNTFPNLVALLTGMNETQLVDSCWPTPSTPFDNCSTIWSNFSEKGYITAYAEDQPGMAPFNNAKGGFKNPPTDHYMRPFMSAVDLNDGNIKDQGYGQFLKGSACKADLIFSYSINFASTYNGHRTFSLFWLNSFSHNDLNMPTTMDGKVFAYLKNLENSGVMNRTMIIFLSDHGLRVGPILQTYIGFLEERMPFLHIWLPSWFKTAYPSKVRNLVRNTNSLTSPFDVYMTLVDILGEKKLAKGCPQCRSLFHLTPWNRSCEDAGIPGHWCSCGEYTELSTKTIFARQLADLVVDKVNMIIAKYESYLIVNYYYCAEVKLKKVLQIRKRKCNLKSCDETFFVIVVQTIPSNAKFEATVSITSRGKRNVLDGISRINSYGDDSRCISHYFAKEFCYCEEEHEYK